MRWQLLLYAARAYRTANFAEGGGLWYIFKPSFGYIIGFIVGTFVTGYIAEHMKKRMWEIILWRILQGCSSSMQ